MQFSLKGLDLMQKHCKAVERKWPIRWPTHGQIKMFFEILAQGLNFWSEITLVKQSRWTATFTWLETTTGIRIARLYRNNHYCRFEDVKSELPSQESNLRPSAPPLRPTILGSFLRLFQHPGVLSEWWNVCTGTPRGGGHLSSGLGWTRPIACAPFTQTAGSHGLDYSNALPVPTDS